MADQQSYSNGQYSQTLVIEGSVMTNATVLTARNQPSIDKYEFYQLIDDTGTWRMYAQGLLGAAIGLGINMLSKIVGSKINPNITFDEWEVYAFGIATLSTIICFTIDKLTNNNRKDIIKKFKTHFDAN